MKDSKKIVEYLTTRLKEGIVKEHNLSEDAVSISLNDYFMNCGIMDYIEDVDPVVLNYDEEMGIQSQIDYLSHVPKYFPLNNSPCLLSLRGYKDKYKTYHKMAVQSVVIHEKYVYSIRIKGLKNL